MRQDGRVGNLAPGLESGGLPNYVLDARLRVPAGAEPGKARLVISHPRDGGPLKVPFRVVDGRSPG
jgi:hypothetical protein